MRLATTTSDFDGFYDSYAERVQGLYEAGFRYIDLGMYHIRENDELLLSEHWRDTVKQLQKLKEELGVEYVQAHAPGGNSFRNYGEFIPRYEMLIKTTIRSIEVCGELGIPNIVVHCGCKEDVGKEGFFEGNKEFFEKILPYAEEHNVNILCENSSKINVACDSAYYANSGKDMREFVEYVNHPNFHACWDTGHANMEGSQYDDIMALGEHLYAVHINDNRETRDDHTMSFMGTVNMDEVMCALIDSGYKGYFTMEAGGTLLCMQGKRRSFERDTRLRYADLSIQQSMEKCMYEIMKHTLEVYHCFEE